METKKMETKKMDSPALVLRAGMALIRSTIVLGPQLVALRSSSATAPPMWVGTAILSLERGQLLAVLVWERAGKVNLGLEESSDERRHWTAVVRL